MPGIGVRHLATLVYQSHRLGGCVPHPDQDTGGHGDTAVSTSVAEDQNAAVMSNQRQGFLNTKIQRFYWNWEQNEIEGAEPQKFGR